MSRREPGLPFYRLDVVHKAMETLRGLDSNSINRASVFINDIDEIVIAEIWFDDRSYQWYVDWIDNE